MPGALDGEPPEQRIDGQRQRGRERERAKRKLVAAGCGRCGSRRVRNGAGSTPVSAAHRRPQSSNSCRYTSRWRALNTVESQRSANSVGAASSSTMPPAAAQVARACAASAARSARRIENVLQHGHAQHQVELLARRRGCARSCTRKRQRPAKPAAAARRRASAIIVGLRSTPVTCAPRAASRRLQRPTPQPTSSTRVPAVTRSHGASARRCSGESRDCRTPACRRRTRRRGRRLRRRSAARDLPSRRRADRVRGAGTPRTLMRLTRIEFCIRSTRSPPAARLVVILVETAPQQLERRNCRIPPSSARCAQWRRTGTAGTIGAM